MGTPSKAIKDFMAEYSIASDEIWEVHGSTWVVKHKALERVAVEKGIKWDRPAIVTSDPANKIMVMIAFGALGDHSEWSFGEAAPYNNKNGYPAAMAEKRAKDRVILKLLNAHGSLYSEAEADEFKEPEAKPASKKDAREGYAEIQNEIWATGSEADLDAWGIANKDRIGKQPKDWQANIRATFKEHKQALRQHNGSDQQRMAS